MVTILYQDAHIVVCVKPRGVISQDAGAQSLPALLRAQLGLSYLVPVHRLDRAVGGVMVYAASAEAASALSSAIQRQVLQKMYLAVLRGVPEECEAVWEDLLFHDKNRNKTYVVDRMRKGVKDAKLSYSCLQTVEGRTLARVRLYTGRTHQIRVQFASRKLPLVGDGRYGGKESGTSLGLWAWELSFPHPISGKTMTFRQLPPSEAPWIFFDILRK